MMSTISGFAQTKLGDVACIYTTSSNLDSSVAFYEKLGFKNIMSNTFPSPWVQVSDGSLLIMIRKDATPYIGLTYYANDIDKVAADLEKNGIEFTQKPKEGDPIKRYYIKSPDGFNIMIADNPGGFTQPTGTTMITMKPEDFAVADKYPNKQCGVFGEFCHPATNLENSLSFWNKLGFSTKAKMHSPYPHAILSDGMMIISLHQTKEFSYPAVTYFSLRKNNEVLTTPEGQKFFLFSIGM